MTDESSARFNFSHLFRKRKCAFPHELSPHFVKLKTNSSPLWLLRDSKWKKKRKRNSYTVCVQVEQTPPEAFTVWAGKEWVGKSHSRQSSARATYFYPCLTEGVCGSRDRVWTVSNTHFQTRPRPSQVYALRLCHAFAVSMVTAYLPEVLNVWQREIHFLFISSPSRFSK